MNRKASAIAMAASLVATFAVAAETPAPAPPPTQTIGCSDAPETKQLDFWLGEWRTISSSGEGTNVITKDFDGCVVREAFDGGPALGGFRGMSVSLYHAQTKQWRQTWVDNQGAYFDLTGGPDGKNFVLTNIRIKENAPHLRMVFEDIAADTFTWRWQNSKDGKEWKDAWVVKYVRKT